MDTLRFHPLIEHHMSDFEEHIYRTNGRNEQKQTSLHRTAAKALLCCCVTTSTLVLKPHFHRLAFLQQHTSLESRILQPGQHRATLLLACRGLPLRLTKLSCTHPSTTMFGQASSTYLVLLTLPRVLPT